MPRLRACGGLRLRAPHSALLPDVVADGRRLVVGGSPQAGEAIVQLPPQVRAGIGSTDGVLGAPCVAGQQLDALRALDRGLDARRVVALESVLQSALRGLGHPQVHLEARELLWRHVEAPGGIHSPAQSRGIAGGAEGGAGVRTTPLYLEPLGVLHALQFLPLEGLGHLSFLFGLPRFGSELRDLQLPSLPLGDQGGHARVRGRRAPPRGAPMTRGRRPIDPSQAVDVGKGKRRHHGSVKHLVRRPPALDEPLPPLFQQRRLRPGRDGACQSRAQHVDASFLGERLLEVALRLQFLCRHPVAGRRDPAR
mmetsp:Transcript_30706/g.88649  ORF Transcript_30706/g.88649 Transcript_30706/m.88649 type:complete len:309 (-) Transcript_30706:1252-2178(-)